VRAATTAIECASRGVGLAVVPSVEDPDPGGEFGRHVDDAFARLRQPQRQRTADSHAVPRQPMSVPARKRRTCAGFVAMPLSVGNLPDPSSPP
jgi:hypothetical protein